MTQDVSKLRGLVIVSKTTRENIVKVRREKKISMADNVYYVALTYFFVFFGRKTGIEK